MSIDEQQIRAQIAQIDSGQPGSSVGTNDRIFWSNAYKRPVIAPERGVERPGDRAVSNRKEGSQRNKTTVVRIEIAKSGDLAYEYSNSEVSFELKDGQKISIAGWAMRAWRKEAGEWRVAAHFSGAYQD